MKRSVNGLAAAGIIYRAKNPSQIFIEVKDDGHPIKHARRKMCFIGGNWIGENAKEDKSPYDTYHRELNEEISFERPMRNSLDYVLLGVALEENFAPTSAPTVKPTELEKEMLSYLKKKMTIFANPFGDYVNTVTIYALNKADPDNKREGFSSLTSYWQVGLNEEDWTILESLQKKFNNLSNESLTLITSLEEILAHRIKSSFSHDRVLADFFLSKNLIAGKNIPMVSQVFSEFVGTPLVDYKLYLEKYNVARHPLNSVL